MKQGSFLARFLKKIKIDEKPKELASVTKEFLILQQF
jgi:hypothetical protein